MMNLFRFLFFLDGVTLVASAYFFITETSLVFGIAFALSATCFVFHLIGKFDKFVSRLLVTCITVVSLKKAR